MSGDPSPTEAVAHSDQPPSTTKAKILNAAISLLKEVGPTSFETKEVANRAGVNQSQVNYHFGSRDGLLAEASWVIFEQHNTRMMVAIEAQEDPRRGIEAYVEHVIDFTTSYPGVGVLVGFPQLFAPTLESWRRDSAALHNLDASEKMATVLISCTYAIHTGKKYKRLNRAKIALVSVRYPRVVDAVVLIGMAMGGFAQVWGQHNERPMFGFDPRRSLRRAVNTELNYLAKGSSTQESEDTDLFT